MAKYVKKQIFENFLKEMGTLNAEWKGKSNKKENRNQALKQMIDINEKNNDTGLVLYMSKNDISFYSKG